LATFRHLIAIEPTDIDHMGHVNNAVYLKWVQEAVVDYWSSVAPPSAVAEHLWVALKHEITYLRPTFLQDKVVAEVIAEKVEGARAFFRTVLRRDGDVLSHCL
jgi:acyl-CoA thioester hydrolase